MHYWDGMGKGEKGIWRGYGKGDGAERWPTPRLDEMICVGVVGEDELGAVQSEGYGNYFWRLFEGCLLGWGYWGLCKWLLVVKVCLMRRRRHEDRVWCLLSEWGRVYRWYEYLIGHRSIQWVSMKYKKWIVWKSISLGNEWKGMELDACNQVHPGTTFSIKYQSWVWSIFKFESVCFESTWTDL
jgi:hypothetical protein